jgi:hypothetical protein
MPRKDPEARREYHREYQKRWYAANRELHIRRLYASATKRRALLMERVNELKARPCADCGVQYPPYIMDFDHVTGEKLDDVCGLRRRMMEWEKIAAEVAKCDVVCSNCHRARTYFRRLGIERSRPNLAEILAANFVVVAVPAR